jgi:hypothetical protein
MWLIKRLAVPEGSEALMKMLHQVWWVSPTCALAFSYHHSILGHILCIGKARHQKGDRAIFQ